jgi:hypothetical protein
MDAYSDVSMWVMCRTSFLLACSIVLVGCVGSIDEGAFDEGMVTIPPDGPTPSPDAGVLPDAPPAMPGASGVAPPGAVPGERSLGNGVSPVMLESTQTIYRIEAEAGEHVAFELSFSGASGVTMAADRWTGTQAVEIGMTNAGPGLRFLSVLDPEARRTYWVRLRASASAPATLKVTRTLFPEGPACAADCARLIQMPLPNDPETDGYDIDGGTHFRYWFGRRDLIMLVRHAARERARAGKAPFFPYDFSQWNGLTPGSDTGSLRHASHQRGKDVDISLYGLDGGAHWRSFCQTQNLGNGRECVPGTRRNFDGFENARMFGAHFVSGRVTMSFLDRELIPAVVEGARKAVADGLVPSNVLPLYSDGRHIQHWPNHDNHIHVRVSEAEYGARILGDEPFEAP